MKRHMGADAGQDLVEYALVLPLFLLLVLGVIEFGLLYFQYSMITNAAREGARAGVVRESESCSTTCLETYVKAAARAIVAGLDANDLDVTVQWLSSGSEIPQVRVTVSYDTAFMTKMMIEAVGGDGDITLQSTATMQREY